MSEHSPPPLPPNDPYRAPSSNAPPPPGSKDEGSVGVGIILGIALLLLGTPATGVLLAAAANLMASAGLNFYPLWMPLALAPLILVIATAIWFSRKGQRKTAKGVWLGAAITIGLVLLLVAACFGLLAGSNFH